MVYCSSSDISYALVSITYARSPSHEPPPISGDFVFLGQSVEEWGGGGGSDN